jgi:sugar/nucleoside kinase (ribokinase family)
MAVVIGEVVTETAAAPTGAGDANASATASGMSDEAQLDLVVRRATERVLETLRREWDR